MTSDDELLPMQGINGRRASGSRNSPLDPDLPGKARFFLVAWKLGSYCGTEMGGTK